MTTDVLEPWADDVYAAALEPRRRGPVARFVCGALDLWCASFGGSMELTRAVDVVVRRTHDGAEEFRWRVDDATEAQVWLASVRADLMDLTPAEFRARWGLSG